MQWHLCVVVILGLLQSVFCEIQAVDQLQEQDGSNPWEELALLRVKRSDGDVDDSLERMKRDKRDAGVSLERVKRFERDVDVSLEGLERDKRDADDSLERMKRDKRDADDSLERMKRDKRDADDSLERMKRDKRDAGVSLERVKRFERDVDVSLEGLERDKRGADVSLERMKRDKRDAEDSLETIKRQRRHVAYNRLQRTKQIVQEEHHSQRTKRDPEPHRGGAAMEKTKHKRDLKNQEERADKVKRAHPKIDGATKFGQEIANQHPKTEDDEDLKTHAKKKTLADLRRSHSKAKEMMLNQPDSLTGHHTLPEHHHFKKQLGSPDHHVIKSRGHKNMEEIAKRASEKIRGKHNKAVHDLEKLPNNHHDRHKKDKKPAAKNVDVQGELHRYKRFRRELNHDLIKDIKRLQKGRPGSKHGIF